jgi:hypothetical protein
VPTAVLFVQNLAGRAMLHLSTRFGH